MVMSLLLLASVLLGCVGCSQSKKPDKPDFRSTYFGATQKEVIESEREDNPSSQTAAEVSYRDIYVVAVHYLADLTYSFNDSGLLYKAEYDFNPPVIYGISAYDADKCKVMFEELKQSLIKTYGDPSSERPIATEENGLIESGYASFDQDRFSVRLLYGSAENPYSGLDETILKVTYTSETVKVPKGSTGSGL